MRVMREQERLGGQWHLRFPGWQWKTLYSLVRREVVFECEGGGRRQGVRDTSAYPTSYIVSEGAGDSE